MDFEIGEKIEGEGLVVEVIAVEGIRSRVKVTGLNQIHKIGNLKIGAEINILPEADHWTFRTEEGVKLMQVIIVPSCGKKIISKRLAA